MTLFCFSFDSKIKRNVGYAEKGYGRVGRNVKTVRLMTGLVDRPGWLD